MSEPEKTLYYPVWVATEAGRRSSLCWGKSCDTPQQADAVLKDRLADGSASLGFVVRFRGGERDVMHGHTVPPSARKVIDHLIALEDALDRGERGEA
jgi:hypothetical protein